MRDFTQKVQRFFGLDDPLLFRRFIICLVLSLVGFAVGAAACGSLRAAGNEKLAALENGFLPLNYSPTFASLLSKSLLSSLVYAGICLLSGFFAFGMVLSGAAVFIRGLGCGLIAGLLCSTAGISGFLYYLLGFVPGFALGCAAFGYLAALTCSSSVTCFGMLTGKGKRKENNPGVYIGYGIGIFGIFLGGVLEAALGTAFAALV